MKRVKPMLWAIVFSLALSISVHGGDIQAPGSPALCNSCYISNEIQVASSDATSSAETSQETPGFAVDLLLALLSFF